MAADDNRSGGIRICKTAIHKYVYGVQLSGAGAGGISESAGKFGLTAEFTGEKGNLHGSEIIWGNETAFRHHLVFRILFSFGELQTRLILRWHSRQTCGGGCRFRAREAAQLVDCPVDSLREAFPIGSFSIRSADVEGQNVARLEAR